VNLSLFLGFLVIYLAVLYMLMTRIKRYFPQFYLKEKKQIAIASFSIVFSILARIFINTIYSIPSVMKNL
jgi:hypothetical protein